MRSKRCGFDLFLVSFLILFLELACIRYFGSTVVFLTFFTNIVLMACFLGMTVGLLAASRKANLIHSSIFLLALSVGAACLVLWSYQRFGKIMIDVGGQNSPQLIFFGTEYRPRDPSHFIIPIEAVAGFFYVSIALTFVGLGQVMGRLFNEIPDRVRAYTFNVLGSLAGISVFGLASYFQSSPLLWFSASLALCLYFIRRCIPLQIMAALAVLVGVFLTSYSRDPNTKILWSPYYKIQYFPERAQIDTNNIMHQQMLRIAQSGPAYALPHLLNRDSGGSPFEKVMIIGAGSGNDVEAALSFGAKQVDAVEIDPVINGIGRKDHPDQPYQDPRVTIHLDDGRSFAQKTEIKYDLAIYALVDSLVLHSGYSSLRLESFLFTEEAFRDIRKVLKPGGVFALYNYYRQGWVVARLAKLAEKVFGVPPLVISLPYQETISPEDNQANHITFIIAGDPDSPVLKNIRSRLKEKQFFWINSKPSENLALNAFSPVSPSAPQVKEDSWMKFGPAHVKAEGVDLLPSDDWPFLYLKDRVIPTLNLKGMALIAFLSFFILFAFAPVKRIRPNGRMFFLGAGFMLLETKGVVHMALLFGSTWIVNSVVFFAILVMTLLANFYVLRFRPKNIFPFYLLLFAALIMNILIPMNQFLALSGALKVVLSCSVVFVPVFFAGVIFAVCFRESRSPDVDFGSNIGGVILGGISEYFSLVLGFNHLLWFAIGFYLLSIVFRPKSSTLSFATET